MKLSDLKSYNVVSGAPVAQIPKAQPSLGQRVLDTASSVANFIGAEGITEQFGADIARATVPEDQKNLIAYPSMKKVVGSAIQTGANLLPGAGVGASLATKVGIGAATGYAFDVGSKLQQNKTLTQAAIPGAGTAVGAALPVAGAGLRAIGKQIEQLPSRFVNSALSRSKAEVLKDIARDNVDNFAKYVVNKKPIGSAKKLLQESIENISKIDNQVNEALEVAARKGGGAVTVGRNNLLDEVTKLPEAEGALLKRNDVRAIVERLAPQTKKLLQKESLTLTETNRLRSLIDKTLGDRAFLGGQLSSDKAVLKSFANLLRETVKNKAPAGTRELFTEFANEIRFRDGLLDRIAQRAGNQVLSFGDFIGGGLGGVFGSLGANPVAGAVAGVAARRAIESVPFKVGSAKLVTALTKLGPILEGLAPATQKAILNLIVEIISEGETNDSTPSPQM